MARVEEYFLRLRTERVTQKPWNSLGITLDKIQQIVKRLGFKDPSIAEVILALLDDDLENCHPAARRHGYKFSDGASTAQIACHVGVFQRGQTKLDREGRDYWIKPLREIGAMELVYCAPQSGRFLPGHKAKSPNNCYRLEQGFVEVLEAEDWQTKLDSYLLETQVGRRLAVQANAASHATSGMRSSHSFLIRECETVYAPTFLSGYGVVYIDDGDGDRITEKQRKALQGHGIELTLDDCYPDMILVSESTRSVWIIEAVTNDGEVDQHKVSGCRRIAKRAGLKLAGLTTAYPDWKTAAARQGRMKNIAPGSYIWILEDAGRQFLVTDLPDEDP